MKRLAVFFVVCGVMVSANAQSYLGAIKALTSASISCSEQTTDCKKSGKGWRLYGGSRLTQDKKIDLGFIQIDGIEVGYSKFSEVTSRGVGSVDYLDSDGEAQVRDGVANFKIQADALTAAAVTHFQIVDDLTFSARLGVAYVSSTVRTTLDGLPKKASTASKIKPYLGVGFEYTVIPDWKVVGMFDMTQFDVDGTKGTLKMFGLGAEASF